MASFVKVVIACLAVFTVVESRDKQEHESEVFGYDKLPLTAVSELAGSPELYKYLSPPIPHVPKENKLAFASYYGNHMVLQRTPQKATIWGYASKMEDVVTLTLSGVGIFNTTVKKGPFPNQGVWSFQLPPVQEGGPYTISVTSSEGSIQLTDVMFGDVWLCSGQSNMQFTLPQGFNASFEIEDSKKYPNLRVFTVPLKPAAQPQFELLGVEEPWSVPDNATVGNSNWTYFSAVCWLYGKYLHQELKYPIGLLATSYGGTPVEAWSSPDALAKCKSDRHGSTSRVDIGPGDNSVLWNAMVHPLLNLTIFSAIWYQGEANAAPPTMNMYNCRFPAMIDDWRVKFNEGSLGQTNSKFPFGFVQLAPNRNISNITSGFPDIRWHQTADMGKVPNPRMDNVFMAVAMDLPDFTSPFGSIHPRDKQDVAQRLTLSGLAVAYNRTDISFQGPWPLLVVIFVGQNQVEIEYDFADKGLDIRSKDGFEFCCDTDNSSLPCSDPKATWYQGSILQHDGNTLKLSYDKRCKGIGPSVIRYAWRESPCGFKACAVYGADTGLPAPPFIRQLLGDNKNRVRFVTS